MSETGLEDEDLDVSWSEVENENQLRDGYGSLTDNVGVRGGGGRGGGGGREGGAIGGREEEGQVRVRGESTQRTSPSMLTPDVNVARHQAPRRSQPNFGRLVDKVRSRKSDNQIPGDDPESLPNRSSLSSNQKQDRKMTTTTTPTTTTPP